jgi:predicted TIM-barrel fold metal-dependent hydrolase
MEIVDSQIHRPLPLDPWPDAMDQGARLVADIELNVAAMEAVGVDAAVIYSSTEYCAAAAQRYPDRFVGVPTFYTLQDLENERGAVDVNAFFAGLRRRQLVGFRLVPDRRPFDPETFVALVREGRWEPALTAAEQHHVPLVILIPQRIQIIKEIVQKHGDLTVIVDHLGMGMPPATPLTDSMFGNVPDLIELARFPQVAVKFSGVAALSHQSYPFADLWPALHQIIDAFGPERLMWGSDYTRVTGRWLHPRHPEGRLDYGELLNFLRYTNEVSEADKEVMLSGAVRRWFDWPKAK